MFCVNGKNELVVEPSFVPIAVGKEIVIANAENGFDRIHALTVKWIAQSGVPKCITRGQTDVVWYLEEVDGTPAMQVLSYSIPGHSKVELFRHAKVAGIIVWLNQQFSKLLPDLGEL